MGDVLDDRRRHITDLKEIAEPLEGLQQDQKSKAGYLTAGDSVRLTVSAGSVTVASREGSQAVAAGKSRNFSTRPP